jgi:hypothetical protein
LARSLEQFGAEPSLDGAEAAKRGGMVHFQRRAAPVSVPAAPMARTSRRSSGEKASGIQQLRRVAKVLVPNASSACQFAGFPCMAAVAKMIPDRNR